jgi:hypothetical protein
MFDELTERRMDDLIIALDEVQPKTPSEKLQALVAMIARKVDEELLVEMMEGK